MQCLSHLWTRRPSHLAGTDSSRASTRAWVCDGRIVTACLCKRPRRLARPRTSPFHGGNTGSNPVGDANSFQELPSNAPIPHRHKKAQLRAAFYKLDSAATSIHALFQRFVAGTKKHSRESLSRLEQRTFAAGEQLYFELFVFEASRLAYRYPVSPGWKRDEAILASP